MYLEMLRNSVNKAEDTSPMTKSAVANKAFRYLAKKGISPYNSKLTRTVPAGIRYSDLTIPLKERVGSKFSFVSNDSLFTSYGNYLARVWSKDPGIARFNAFNEKLDRVKNLGYRLSNRPHALAAEPLMNDIIFNGYYPFAETIGAQARAIPRITVYKSKVPSATTHHLADGKASLAANKAAQNAQPGELYIKNPNPDAGHSHYRSQNFRINTPGTPWGTEELKLMRTSPDLSDTNLFETVFSRTDRNFPNAIATYVPDTPAIRQALSLKPDVKGVTIDELQSKVQGVLYNGKRTGRIFKEDWSKSYMNAVRRYAPDRFKNKLNTLWEAYPLNKSIAPERWFAPSSRTAMHFIEAKDSQKFIRLDSDALRRLRGAEFSNSVPQLEAYTDADWANLFKARHQQDRLANIIKQIETQRENVMPENLYWLAHRHRYING